MNLPTTPADALSFALHFDDRVAEGLSLDDQVSFLLRWRDDPEFEALPPQSDIVSLLRDTSIRYWDIFRPGNLARLPSDLIPDLANILIRRDTRLGRTLLDHIVNSLDILPPETRAVFCAVQMQQWDWWDERRFFETCFRRLTYLSRAGGCPGPSYPAAFTSRDFLHSIPASYGSILPAPLQNAIEDDAPIPFAIALDLCGRRLAKSLLLHLFSRHAGRILADNLPALSRALPLADVVLYCASSLPSDPAATLLQAIDRDSPGFVASAVDLFGNNALWYLFYRRPLRHWARPTSLAYTDPDQDTRALETALLAFGCSPDRPNLLALTPRHIQTALHTLQTRRDS